MSTPAELENTGSFLSQLQQHSSTWICRVVNRLRNAISLLQLFIDDFFPYMNCTSRKDVWIGDMCLTYV